MLNEQIKTLPESEKELVLKQLNGEISKFFPTCGDSNCDVIWQDWMDICPCSLDHKGWEDEGLLNAELDFLGESVKYEEMRKEIWKMKEQLLEEKKKFIVNNAPFSLLTTGWGQEEEKSNNPLEKEKDILQYKPLSKLKNPTKVLYLIYKEEKRKKKEEKNGAKNGS